MKKILILLSIIVPAICFGQIDQRTRVVAGSNITVNQAGNTYTVSGNPASATPTVTITGAGTTSVTSSGAGTTAPSYTVNTPAWSLTGNSGTTAGTNFIGTKDAVDFVTKTNNVERSRIDASGNYTNTLTNYSFLNTSSLQGSGIKFIGGITGNLLSVPASFSFGINNLVGNSVGMQWQKNSLDIQAGFRSDSSEHWVQSFFTCGTNGVRRLNRIGLHDSTYATIDLTKSGGYHSYYYADYDSTSILSPSFKINAPVRINDGTQGLNKVFTSNASGLGTWATPTVSLTSQVTGVLPIANGGTNATTANTALNNLLPSQTGKANYLWYSDGTNTNLTNTPSVSNITASGAVTTNTLTVNGNRLSNQRIGTIFSDNVSTAGNYTVTTTNGSATFTSGCTLTGNTGNFSKTKITYKYNSSLANTGVGIFLNQYTVSAKFVVTANTTASYGAGIGLDQYGNNTWAIMMSNKVGTTRGTIYIVDPIDSSIKATSATALSYTNSTDTIYLEWRFEKNTIYATAKNITTPTVVTASVTVPNVATVVWSPAPSVTPTVFRAGRPAIYCYSGTQIYTNLSLSSEQFTNPKIALIGDSQVLGLGASSNSKTYASYLGFGIDNKQMIWAEGGAEVADLHNSFSELSNVLNGEHAYILMFIGGNDVIQGRTLSQIQGDYLNLLNDILNAGCIPLPGKICYVKSTYSNAATINAGITALNTWIGTLPFTILDENTSTSTGGNMNPVFTTDGGHFNDYGCIVWAKTLATQVAPIYQTNNDFSRGGWIDFSGLLTNTGWAATPSPNAESFSLSANGTIMKVKLYISGTSNSATTSLSIPFTSTSRANSYSLNPIGIIDNGGTEVWGNAQINPSQTIIVLYKDPAGTTWTATGAKTAIGQLEFEIQ